MRPNSLLDNLTSDFLAAFSALLPKGTRQRVLVYVESDEDIAFWRNVLYPFEGNEITFDIQLPFKKKLEKGKTAALSKNQELLNIEVGTHLIICLDSDYDYLLQDTTPQSKVINNNDFIFQTYTYSIENMLCLSTTLHSVCVQATKNDKKLIIIEDLIQLYSHIIHKLLVWSVHFHIKQDVMTFTISDFCATVKILDKVDIYSQCEVALSGLMTRVKNKINELERDNKEDVEIVESLSERLKTLGLDKDTAYLFAQGHLIMDNVVLRFLKPISAQLKKEKEAEIRDSAKHISSLSNQMNAYQNQLIPIETALRNNTDYKSCFLYLKLQDDLIKYIKTVKK